MRFLVGAASLVIIAAGLRATGVILMPLVLAVFLSVITFPLVQRLRKRGIHHALSSFMLFEAADILHRRPTVLPAELRQHLARIAEEMQTWLWVKTIISFATGLVAGVWVAVLGIEFALLWGLMAFLLNYIPNLGSLIAAFPPALLALIQFGPLSAALVVAGYLVINIGFGSFMEPYLMGRRVGLSPLAVLLSVIVWGWMWGIPGMLLSVPITMGIKIALENSSDDTRWVARLMEGGNRERS